KDKYRLDTGLRPERLAFRPRGAQLAVAGDHVVRVLDLEQKKALFPDLPHPDDVNWIAWHPDRRILATTCNDLRIRLWAWGTGKRLLPPLGGHGHAGMVVAFNPAGDCLLSNDWGGALRLWDPRAGRQLLQTQSAANAFSRDGDLLALDRSDSRVRLQRV